MKIEFWWRQIFEIPGVPRCPTKKFGPDGFSRFDVYWIQTDRQTNKQTDKPNVYTDYGGLRTEGGWKWTWMKK